ncbi:hypothetical protein GO755_35310 [Spirosoma sp. HMF4905]|uniref:Uncharacterized protein n=1 Tax=Spirosoma arboris TaxID=2682092 RepID=A0A7K1SNG9_9BACT|nr:hypothetical protein [Spirosoma arboris]MVM35345.1 hypothetical protein [Spirosoma arboris]
MQITYQHLFYALLVQLTMAGQLRAQQTADVRQVRWGFSPKLVKEAESLKPTSTRKDKIVYSRVPLVNRTGGLEYDFNGDSLLSATYYYYTTPSITQSDVTAASTELEGLLAEKYGPGKIVQVGELRTVNWLTPRTQIRLALGNVDRGWSLEIVYLCRVCSGDPKVDSQTKGSWKAKKEINDL